MLPWERLRELRVWRKRNVTLEHTQTYIHTDRHVNIELEFCETEFAMWWKFFFKEFFETTMEISVENCHLQLGIFCNSLSPLGDTMTQQNTAVVFFQLLRFSNMDKTFFVDDAVSYKKSSTRTYQAPLHPNYFQNSNFETIATYPREHVCSLHLNSLTLEFVGCYKYWSRKSSTNKIF